MVSDYYLAAGLLGVIGYIVAWRLNQMMRNTFIEQTLPLGTLLAEQIESTRDLDGHVVDLMGVLIEQGDAAERTAASVSDLSDHLKPLSRVARSGTEIADGVTDIGIFDGVAAAEGPFAKLEAMVSNVITRRIADRGEEVVDQLLDRFDPGSKLEKQKVLTAEQKQAATEARRARRDGTDHSPSGSAPATHGEDPGGSPTPARLANMSRR